MKRQLKVAIPFVVVGYLLLCLTVYCFQAYTIFRSNDIYFAPPANLAVEEVFIPTPDGEKLFAWWRHTDAAEQTILFFQGNGVNISYQGDRLATFRAMGANALFVDYRGYGKSSGRIRTERDIYMDGEAAWNFLVKEKRIAPEKIVVWGRSLGGAVATETALHQEAAALVLESTFYSMDEMARRKYWYLPTRLLLNFHFANGDKLQRVRLPVIILHSGEDGYIPFSQAARLYAAANEPKTLVRTRGSHIDSFESNPQDFERLQRILDGLKGRS